MFPREFEYHAPKTINEALQLLSEYGEDAKLLAGGQSLIPLLKLRVMDAKHLIDLRPVQTLSYVKQQNGSIAVGAMTTHYEIETSKLLKKRCPLISEVAATIGDMQVRNMGTIGGSISHADPAADYPAAILALEAELTARSLKGERSISANEFFQEMFTTALRPDEILTEIRIPVAGKRSGSAYEKLVVKATDFAVVGAAAVINLNGVCEKVRVALTGVGPKAVRAFDVERALEGRRVDEKVLKEASKKASVNLNPASDIRGSVEYKKAMAEVETLRALRRAVTDAKKRK